MSQEQRNVIHLSCMASNVYHRPITKILGEDIPSYVS